MRVCRLCHLKQAIYNHHRFLFLSIIFVALHYHCLLRVCAFISNIFLIQYSLFVFIYPFLFYFIFLLSRCCLCLTSCLSITTSVISHLGFIALHVFHKFFLYNLTILFTLHSYLFCFVLFSKVPQLFPQSPHLFTKHHFSDVKLFSRIHFFPKHHSLRPVRPFPSISDFSLSHDARS